MENTEIHSNATRGQGYLFALAATAIWSGNFILARGLSEQIPPVSLVFAPFAVKGVIRERNLLGRHWRYFSITSFWGITCFNTFFIFQAIQRLPPIYL